VAVIAGQHAIRAIVLVMRYGGVDLVVYVARIAV
jgi:hypothetical protein